MIRAVLDEVVPADAADIFANPGTAVDRFPDSWRSLPDHRLLSLAQGAGFDWLVTCDKRMPYQQNREGRSISVLVLHTPKLVQLVLMKREVQHILSQPRPGLFVIVDQAGQISTAPVAHVIGRAER